MKGCHNLGIPPHLGVIEIGVEGILDGWDEGSFIEVGVELVGFLYEFTVHMLHVLGIGITSSEP